jgi:hypothetical protein
VAYAWEAGRAHPTAASFFRIVERSGKSVAAALANFYRVPAQGPRHDLRTAAGVAAFLDDLRGRTSLVDLARSAQRSRFAVARWLKGEAEPRLPDFLRLVESASLRVLDFVACFVDPLTLPSVAGSWQTLENARRAAYELPWSHAVLRVVELAEFQKTPGSGVEHIAERLGIPEEEAERCVKLLLQTGQLQKRRGRLLPGSTLTVDTRGDPARSRRLKAFWTNVALERLEAGNDGTFSYNLFSVSHADLERIRELHRGFFRELRRIVAASEPAECIALANVHLLELRPQPRPPRTP